MIKQVDVAVIGGGVIGVCAAYYLREAGRKVTIIEQGSICSGSSYGNGGLLVPSHSMPLAAPGAITQGLKWIFNPESPFYIQPRLNLDLIRWLWKFRAAANEQRMKQSLPIICKLSGESVSLYEDLISKEDLRCNFAHVGTLTLYRSKDGFKGGEEEARLLAQHGISSQSLNSSQIREIEPSAREDIAGGILHQDDAHIKPDEFVHGLASRFQEQGGVIETNTAVTGFDVSGHKVNVVNTARDKYHVKQVILATGAWSANLVHDLGIRLPIQPAKGYSITFERPDEAPHIPIMLGEAKVGVTPMGKFLRLAGTLELSGLNLDISNRRVTAVVQAPQQYLSVNMSSLSSQIWCGMRPLSPDGLPMIGMIDSMKNVIVATGHSMTGMTLGPATGKLVTQIANGDHPIMDPAPFSPMRFN